MANTILLKRSSTTTNVPTAGELSQGELAINTADERLFSKNSSNVVFEITDHDNLTNYVANEHIDWTSTTASLSTSGTISGVNVTSGSDPGHTHTAYAASSHTHTFDSLTSKTAGTGDYLTTGDIGSGENSGGVAMTINDGYGNANLTFNHRNGTPDNTSATQSAYRIEASTDSNTATWSFEMGNSTVQDTPVALTQVMQMTTSAIDFQVNVDCNAGLDVTGTMAATTVTGANVTSGVDPGHTHSIYLTAESDTLATVTGRGATTATASTFSGGINMSDSDLNRPVLEDYGVKHTAPTVSANAVTVNLTLGNSFLIDMDPATAAVTLTLSNPPASGTYGEANLIIVMGTPAYGITWPGSIVWQNGGTAPTLSTTNNEVDLVHLFTVDGGTTWYGTYALAAGATGGATTLAALTDTDITTPADASLLLYDTGTATWRDAAMSGDATITDTGVITVSSAASADSVAAANVAAGSLANGVNSYFAATSGNFAYKIPFMNYTGISNTNASMLHDNGSTFTYNPSTNTLSVGTCAATTVTGANVTSGTDPGHTHSAYLTSAVTSVAAGNGMSFTTITGTGSVTMGTPGTLTASTSNGTTTTSHTHAITTTGTGTIVASTSPTFVTKSTHDTIFLNERASATTDVTGDGQLWVKSNAPNDLYYTTDNGLDYPIAYARYRVTADTTLDGANVSETLGVQHINGCWYSDNATAYTLTLQANTVTTFPVGAQMTIWNEGSGTLTITEGSLTTLYVLTGSAVTDAAGSATMAQGGYATLIRKSTTVYLLMGAGITP